MFAPPLMPGIFANLFFRGLCVCVCLPSRQVEMLGELMFQSHTSYSRCGLGSVGTDRIVQLVRRAGIRAGLYGAKITGGGSGGTVAVLGHVGAGQAVADVAGRYAREFRHRPHVFEGSSPGALAFGHLRLRPTRRAAAEEEEEEK